MTLLRGDPAQDRRDGAPVREPARLAGKHHVPDELYVQGRDLHQSTSQLDLSRHV